MTKTEQEFEKIILPVVEELGYSLYDVEYVKEGADWYLRIFIDNMKGIDLDDCEKVSNVVGKKLDEVDPIDSSYMLEVSSCGLERRLRSLKHYEAALGKNVELKFFKPFENKKSIVGTITNIIDNNLKLKSEEKDYEINLNDISSAKILYNWEEKENE